MNLHVVFKRKYRFVIVRLQKWDIFLKIKRISSLFLVKFKCKVRRTSLFPDYF